MPQICLISPQTFMGIIRGLCDAWEDLRKSPKRCVLALDFRNPDFSSEFYPDSGGYLKNFKSYPDYNIHLEFFFGHFCCKICPTRPPALHYHS